VKRDKTSAKIGDSSLLKYVTTQRHRLSVAMSVKFYNGFCKWWLS